MSDLISRQAAIDALDSIGSLDTDADREYARGIFNALPSVQPEPLTLRVNRELTKEEYDKLMHDIKDAPIVLLPPAQPEIIRCRDCKHWDKTWTNDWSPDYHYCPMIDGVRKGDFYCADAERRTDE